MANMTTDEITTAINTAGFTDAEDLTQALTLLKSFQDAGFTDPSLFTPVLKRFKLLDEKLKLQALVATKQYEQQTQVSQVMNLTNPEINDLNTQIGQIDVQLAVLQG